MRLLYSYIMVCLMVWILLVGKIVEGKINLSAAIAGGVVAVLAAPAMLGYLRRRAKKGEFNLSSSLPRWLFFLAGFIICFVLAIVLAVIMSIMEEYMTRETVNLVLLTFAIAFGGVFTAILSVGTFILEKKHQKQFWMK